MNAHADGDRRHARKFEAAVSIRDGLERGLDARAVEASHANRQQHHSSAGDRLTVVAELARGYKLRDRVLRPAKVAVLGRVYATPAFMPIDHVYAGAAWQTIMVRRGPSMGSDHYPLVVDLGFGPNWAQAK